MGTDLNIGHATAYAYAKSKGYTGTEEQFATELAQFAQNAQKVAEDRAAVEQLVDEFLNTTAPAVIQDVADEGTSQVERVAGAGTAQVTRVGEAGNTQIDAVAAAGTTQIGLVTAEGTTQVTRVQAKGTEVINSIPADYTALTQEVSDLNRQISELYDATSLDDMYGENTSVVKTDNVLISAIWDGDTKTVTVTMSGSASSADSYYVVLSPRFVASHTYKIAIKYLYPNEFAYTYIRNTFSTSNFNSRDDIVNGTTKYNNAEEVLTLNATSDGWLALGIRVGANVQYAWSWKLAIYDVTNIDVSDASDSDFLSFADTITIGVNGLVPQIQAKAEYIYPLVSNVKGETWTALGDSLTAQGSGSQYLGYVANRLGLANYYNCGIGGTTISGATNSNAMYQNVRINALDIGSNCITVMGGSNDFWQEYYKDHPNTNLTGWGDCTRDNYDVSTFCGAYNVLISKILYRFCLIPAYYSNIDYTGITQVSAAIDNFRLILITPPQVFHVEGDSAGATLLLNGITAAHSYVKQIAELWGLPCVDSWEMGMNDINKPLFFANYLTDATHFNAFGHERLASLIIDKALQISRYQ